MTSTPTPIPTTTTAPAPFEFPREYHFPPFFTRQTNLITRHSQLEKWSALILAYCRHHRIYKLSLSGFPIESNHRHNRDHDSSSSSNNNNNNNNNNDEGENNSSEAKESDRDDGGLFYNRRLNRRLGAADAREVFDFMRKEGRAEYVNSNSSSSGGGGLSGIVGGITGGGGSDEEAGSAGDVAWVYWRTPEEWAGLVESWVEGTGQRNTVLTLYELTEGEGSGASAELRGLDRDVLLKALQVLVRRGRAQIFGQEDQQGVKFF